MKSRKSKRTEGMCNKLSRYVSHVVPVLLAFCRQDLARAPAPLLDLPEELLASSLFEFSSLFEYLESEEVIALTMTCRRMHSLFQPDASAAKLARIVRRGGFAADQEIKAVIDTAQKSSCPDMLPKLVNIITRASSSSHRLDQRVMATFSLKSYEPIIQLMKAHQSLLVAAPPVLFALQSQEEKGTKEQDLRLPESVKQYAQVENSPVLILLQKDMKKSYFVYIPGQALISFPFSCQKADAQKECELLESLSFRTNRLIACDPEHLPALLELPAFKSNPGMDLVKGPR